MGTDYSGSSWTSSELQQYSADFRRSQFTSVEQGWLLQWQQLMFNNKIWPQTRKFDREYWNPTVNDTKQPTSCDKKRQNRHRYKQRSDLKIITFHHRCGTTAHLNTISELSSNQLFNQLFYRTSLPSLKKAFYSHSIRECKSNKTTQQNVKSQIKVNCHCVLLNPCFQWLS